MANLSITTCSFHLKKAYSQLPEDIYYLNEKIKIKRKEKEEEFDSCIELIKMFFNNHRSMLIDNIKQQSFECRFYSDNEIDTQNYKMYYAKIYSGIYGSTSDIIDIETKELKYQKNTSDVEIKPFFVFIVIPKDSKRVKVKKGILIFQNVGQYGIKTITTNQMQKFFIENYGISIECYSVAPKLFIERNLKKENIKKLCYIKNYKSGDLADNVGVGYGQERREFSYLNFSESKWSKIFSNILHAAGGKDNIIEFDKKEYDDLKVVVEIGNHTRTINVHNIDKLSIIEDIPDEIKKDNGHPDEQMLIDYVKDVASDYLKEMVLTVGRRD